MTARRFFKPLSRMQLGIVLVLYTLLGLYATGIPQKTIFARDPHVQTYGPLSGEKPQSLVVLLHGANGDGQDILKLGRALASAFPHTVFVAPDGVEPSTDVPLFFQWYGRGFGEDYDDVLRKIGPATSFIQSVVSKQMRHYRLKPEQVVVLGYSQGGTVALYAIPQLDFKIAGVVAFSSFFVGQATAFPQRPPVLLTHGTADWIIPYDDMRRSAETLRAAGFDVRTFTVQGGNHDITDEALLEAAYFMREVLTGIRRPDDGGGPEK